MRGPSSIFVFFSLPKQRRILGGPLEQVSSSRARARATSRRDNHNNAAMAGIFVLGGERRGGSGGGGREDAERRRDRAARPPEIAGAAGEEAPRNVARPRTRREDASADGGRTARGGRVYAPTGSKGVRGRRGRYLLVAAGLSVGYSRRRSA